MTYKLLSCSQSVISSDIHGFDGSGAQINASYSAYCSHLWIKLKKKRFNSTTRTKSLEAKQANFPDWMLSTNHIFHSWCDVQKQVECSGDVLFGGLQACLSSTPKVIVWDGGGWEKDSFLFPLSLSFLKFKMTFKLSTSKYGALARQNITVLRAKIKGCVGPYLTTVTLKRILNVVYHRHPTW